jgi:hypothetical protein
MMNKKLFPSATVFVLAAVLTLLVVRGELYT